MKCLECVSFLGLLSVSYHGTHHVLVSICPKEASNQKKESLKGNTDMCIGMDSIQDEISIYYREDIGTAEKVHQLYLSQAT